MDIRGQLTVYPTEVRHEGRFPRIDEGQGSYLNMSQARYFRINLTLG